MNRLLRSTVATLLATALLAPSAHAQQKVYQWKDAQGRTHYSSSPPPSGRFQVRGARASAPVAAAENKPGKADNAQCAQARSNLTVLRSHGTNVRIDSDGDGKPDRVLTAEEHTNQVKLAESLLNANCGGVDNKKP